MIIRFYGNGKISNILVYLNRFGFRYQTFESDLQNKVKFMLITYYGHNYPSTFLLELVSDCLYNVKRNNFYMLNH